jgi:hypothetical protein
MPGGVAGVVGDYPTPLCRFKRYDDSIPLRVSDGHIASKILSFGAHMRWRSS